MDPLRPELEAAIGTDLGSAVVGAATLGGGDTSSAWRVELRDGRTVLVKAAAGVGSTERSGQWSAEAHGLAWLADAAAIAVPDVLAVRDGAPDGATALPPDAYLALTWIEPGPPGDAAELGRALAALHRATPSSFGLDRDNRIGPLPQANEPAATWPTFYAERRLLPLVRACVDAGLLDGTAADDAASLATALPERCGPPEPPARLHGDLWGGNLLWAVGGTPVLIDPAVYGGHREVDLAMMRLFGGFDARTFEAYDEAHPLADAATERVPLYQLYPLLVHALLFGASYASRCRELLRALR